jgi:hypothetical protein
MRKKLINGQEKSLVSWKEGQIMTKNISQQEYYDCYEYHGNTTIELTRRQNGETIWRDWIIFDSVEAASEFFNDHCESQSPLLNAMA